MKRIVLCILVLLFVFSATAVAQTGITYEVGDYFKITYPDNFKVHNGSPSPFISGSSSYTIDSNVVFFAFPIVETPIERRGFNENFTYARNVLKDKKSRAQLEDEGSMVIDNREAKWSLISLYLNSEVKSYWFFYLIYSDHYSYELNATGNYDNLDTDRKTIDKIISSIKILK